MARGAPALWSTLLGLPFVVVGGWLYVGQTTYPSVIGLPFAFFGAFVVGIGAYVHVVSPTEPRLSDGEELVEKRHPTQRVARVKIVVGLPLLVATIYLLFFTTVPYVYPTATFVVGLYAFSSGLYTYWTNSLTTYYVTTRRIIKEYRFLSLVRREIPREKIRGVQERKSAIEALVGLGNVLVASGGGRSLEIRMRNMERSESFADSIRNLVSES
ncbi:PH domain-containing protein [Halorussus ruber]|uniref:PH domain-containing protein n=1 Tax=Halorussus ruber TaxID=1126238 RepID=UPI00109296BB|nr:PH domain-containing protein [Halorussus ruber]